MADNKPTPAGLGYSIDELITGAYKAYEEPEQSISEDITDSFSQTSANIHMSWDALMAGINEATGDYADADRRIQQAIEHGRKSAATAPSTQDLRDIESPGDFVSWLASNSGQLGYMVAGGVPGKIGGLLARGIASKAINRQIRKQLKDMGLGDDIVEAALKNPNLSANAAQALAQRAEVANRLYGKSLTKKNLAETVGTSAGYAAGFMGLETGLNVKDIFDETGTIEPGIAAKYGVPAGLLAAPMGAFYQRALNRNRLKGGSTDAEVQKGVGGILKQAGIGASGEMPIEMIQEATNIYAVREATGNTAPLTADEKWQIINAGAAAFAAGGMVTGGIEGYNKLKNTAYKTGQRIGDLLSAQPGLATENKVRSMLGDDINILGEQDSTIYVDPEGGASAPGAATGPVAPQWEEGSTVEFEVEEEAGNASNLPPDWKEGDPTTFDLTVSGEVKRQVGSDGTVAEYVDLVTENGVRRVYLTINGKPTGNAKNVRIKKDSNEGAQDATFTAEEQERTSEAERELDNVLDASGMDVLRSLDHNFGRSLGDDDTGEATGAPRPETRGQSFEFNQAFPEDENGNTLVRDEKGTTHTLNRNQAGAYRQLWNMTPSFARHLLNTEQAIKFAGALIQNRGGSQDVYNKQITQEAQKIVKLILNTLGNVKMANTIFEGFINGEWESVDAVSKEAGRNLQVNAKTARMFRDASQWLIDNPDFVYDTDFAVDSEGNAFVAPTNRTRPSMADTVETEERSAEIDQRRDEEGLISSDTVYSEGIRVEERSVMGQEPKVIGRHRIQGNEKKPTVTEWDRPFRSQRAVDEDGKKIKGVRGKHGKAQAEAQLNRLTKPGSPGYDNPADIQLREAYNPDTHDFEVRAVDKNGNVLPKNTPWHKAYGHVVLATPVDAREGLSSPRFGTGLDTNVMTRLQQALEKGALYSNRARYPIAHKMVIAFSGTQSTLIHTKTGAPYKTRGAAQRKLNSLPEEQKKDAEIIEVADGFAVKTTQPVKRHVYLPSLIWTGAQMMRATGLVDSTFTLTKNNGNILRALTEGFQGLDEYLQLQGISANTLDQFRMEMIEKDERPVLNLKDADGNVQYLSMEDLASASARIATDVEDTAVAHSEERQEANRELKEEDPNLPVDNFDVDINAQVRSILLPLIRPLIPGRVKGRMGPLRDSAKASIAKTILNLAIQAAFNPQVSLLMGEPSPSLLPNPRASWRAGDPENDAVIAEYDKWNNWIQRLLTEGVPKWFVEEEISVDPENNDGVSPEDAFTEWLMDAVRTSPEGDMLTAEGAALEQAIVETLEFALPNITSDIVARKVRFKEKKLVDPGGVAEQVSYNEANRKERGTTRKNPDVPMNMAKETAKIEGIATGIRAYVLQLSEQANTSPPAQFQKRIALASVENNINDNQNQLMDDYNPDIEQTDPNLKTGQGVLGRDTEWSEKGKPAQQSAQDTIDDVAILQREAEANLDAQQRRGTETINAVNADPLADETYEYEVLGRSRSTTRAQFNLPEDGVIRKSSDGNVIIAGHETFVNAVYMDGLKGLAEWASKAFNFAKAADWIDPNTGEVFSIARQTLILDQEGFDNLVAANPDFARTIIHPMRLRETAAFRVWIPKPDDPTSPFIILVNEDYVYLDAQATPYSVREAREEGIADILTAFSHELGHIVYHTWKETMPKALKEQLVNEWKEAVPQGRRAVYHFDEWSADQFALYTQRNIHRDNREAKVPPAWKRLFAQLRKLYEKTGHFIKQITGRTGGPSAAYHEWLHEIARAHGLQERAREYYYKVAGQEIQRGTAPEDAYRMAAALTRKKLEQAYAEEQVTDSNLQLNDIPSLRTVNPAEAASEHSYRAVQEAENNARREQETLLGAAARGWREGTRSFLDIGNDNGAWENAVNRVFGDSPQARKIIKSLTKMERRVWSSVGTRLNELPGGNTILKKLRERPGQAATGEGTARIKQRRYYGMWLQRMQPLQKRKGESKANFRQRMTLLRDDLATGNPQSEDGKRVRKALQEYARWMNERQTEARKRHVRSRPRLPFSEVNIEEDPTVLRFLSEWTMPHNYNLFNLTTPEGKARFFELMDMYEKDAFMAENSLTTDQDWDTFKQYVFTKITNGEGSLTANFADNLRFANSRSRILRRIPTHEFLGNQHQIALIDDQIDKALRNYLHDGARQVAWEEAFGGYEQNPDTGKWRWNTNLQIKDWVSDLKRRDHRDGTSYATEAEELVDILQGRSNRKLSKKWRVALDMAMAYTNILVLPLAVFASLPDLAGIAMRADGERMTTRRFYQDVKSAASAAWGKDVDGLNKMASMLGVVTEHTIQHAFLDEGDAQFDNFWGGKHQKVMEWQEDFFKFIQLEAYTNFTRILAMQVGRDMMNHNTAVVRVAQARGWTPDSHNPNDPRDKEAMIAYTRLVELTGDQNVNPVEIWSQIVQANEGSQAGPHYEQMMNKQAEILNKFVDEAIMRPSAEQKPGWQSDPRWRTVAHLKSYMWYMQETYWPRIFKKFEDAFGNGEIDADNAKILGKHLLAFSMMLPLAILGLALRDLMYYAGTDDEPPKRDFWDILGRTGGLGSLTIPMEFIDDWDERGFSGNLVARALGPAQGIVYNAAAQQPQTTLSKTVPGVSWFKAGRNVLAGRPNDKDTGELEGTGRYGN